jgi:hypothetical protein
MSGERWIQPMGGVMKMSDAPDRWADRWGVRWASDGLLRQSGIGRPHAAEAADISPARSGRDSRRTPVQSPLSGAAPAARPSPALPLALPATGPDCDERDAMQRDSMNRNASQRTAMKDSDATTRRGDAIGARQDRGVQARVRSRDCVGKVRPLRKPQVCGGRGRATPAPPSGARRRGSAGMRSRSGGGERARPSSAEMEQCGNAFPQ